LFGNKFCNQMNKIDNYYLNLYNIHHNRSNNYCNSIQNTINSQNSISYITNLIKNNYSNKKGSYYWNLHHKSSNLNHIFDKSFTFQPLSKNILSDTIPRTPILPNIPNSNITHSYSHFRHIWRNLARILDKYLD
jgi:hypothetical protein